MLKSLQNNNIAILIALLIAVCIYDLLSPPISVTIARQTQTAMLTDNFAKEGFSLKGLYLGIKGHDKFMVVYEFPIYNFIVGILFKIFNNSPFWGKLISMLASIIALITFNRLVKSIVGPLIAFRASLFFIFLPVSVLMFTSFQPDAFAMMLTMLSVYILNKWRESLNLKFIALYSICMLLGGLCKYPVFVPYIPLCAVLYLFPQGKFRFPKASEISLMTILFVIPFVTWYLYRTNLSDPILLSEDNGIYFIGNLKRFLYPGFYIRPAIMLGILVMCGSGLIYFFSGLRHTSLLNLTLLAGIPFYYIVIPTVADQYYYLYAISPIAALFMARGTVYVEAYLRQHRITFLNYLFIASFMLVALFGITYVLRPDKVVLPASEAIRRVSQPEDLIFIVNMHDRSVAVGQMNPTIAYFADRKVWNIQFFNPDNVENIIAQIDSKRNEGVKWLCVTWYTSDLEAWYSAFLPAQFRRLPKFNSKAIADELERRYPIVQSGGNFAILRLATELDKYPLPATMMFND